MARWRPASQTYAPVSEASPILGLDAFHVHLEGSASDGLISLSAQIAEAPNFLVHANLTHLRDSSVDASRFSTERRGNGALSARRIQAIRVSPTQLHNCIAEASRSFAVLGQCVGIAQDKSQWRTASCEIISSATLRASVAAKTCFSATSTANLKSGNLGSRFVHSAAIPQAQPECTR